MNTYKITRLEKIKEDGVLKSVVIGITASNGTKSVYTDWKANIKDIGTTKQDLWAYIKNYMTEAINQSEIDAAIEKQKNDSKVVIPVSQTRIKSIKARLNTPVITRETDHNLINEELNLEES